MQNKVKIFILQSGVGFLKTAKPNVQKLEDQVNEFLKDESIEIVDMKMQFDSGTTTDSFVMVLVWYREREE